MLGVSCLLILTSDPRQEKTGSSQTVSPRDDYTYHRGGFRGQAVQLIPAPGRSVARTEVLRDDPLSMKPSYRFLDITPRKINIVLALDGF